MYLNLSDIARTEMNFGISKPVQFFGRDENNYLTKLFNKMTAS